MKTRRLALVVLVLTLGLTAPALAHDELGFVGTLVAVDGAKNRITVKYKENGKDETVVIVLTPKTAITRNKVKVAKTTLKTGLTVVIRALGCEDQDPEATEVRIVPAIAAKK